MPQKKCGFGFSCAAMMMQPGLKPENCLNYEACGGVTEYTEEEEIELFRVRADEIERFTITRNQAAKMMLIQRSGSQARGESPTLLSEMVQAIEAIADQLQQLQERLAELEDEYIAPAGCEAHAYNVKRGLKTYWYNKLTATEPIFEPAVGTDKVCTIHLSHSDDPRNLEARRGIQRRNQLSLTKTKLVEIQRQLAAALADLDI